MAVMMECTFRKLTHKVIKQMQKVVSELQYFSIFIFQNEKQGAATPKTKLDDGG